MRSNVDRCTHVRPFLLVSSVMRFQCYNQNENENENKQLLQFMGLHLLVALCCVVFFSLFLFFSSLEWMLCFRNFFLCFLIFFFLVGKNRMGFHHCITAIHPPSFFWYTICECLTKIAKWLSFFSVRNFFPNFLL